MKKLSLLFADMAELFKKEYLSILLVFVSVTLSVASMYPLLAYLNAYSAEISMAETDMRTYSFDCGRGGDMTFSDLTPTEIFDRLFFGGEFPSVRECMVLQFGTAAKISSGDDDYFSKYDAYTQNSLEGFESRTFLPYFGHGCSFDPAEPKLVAGRYFSEGDRDAVVISQTDHPDAKLGDIISIAGRDAEVIGISSEFSYLPYSFIRECKDEDIIFCFYIKNAVFSERLGRAQLDALDDFCRGSTVSYSCRYDSTKQSYTSSAILFFSIVLGILSVAVLNMLGMFRHIINKCRYRLAVMKVLGASDGIIMLMAYAWPTVITVLAFIASAVLSVLILMPYAVNELGFLAVTFAEYAVMLLFTLLFEFAVLWPPVRRILRSRPADVKMWR